MGIYTVHLRRQGLDPDRDLVLVKEGFCWPAFFFAILWALWLRLWRVALILIAAEVVLGVAMVLAGADSVTQGIGSAGLAAIIGFLANDLRRGTLGRRGFVQVGVVCGGDRETAAHRFLHEQPDLAAVIRP